MAIKLFEPQTLISIDVEGLKEKLRSRSPCLILAVNFKRDYIVEVTTADVIVNREFSLEKDQYITRVLLLKYCSTYRWD